MTSFDYLHIVLPIVACLLYPLLVVYQWAPPLPSGWSSPASPRVTLGSGTFTGASARGVDSWLGIPYAQQPVGELRYASPRAVRAGTAVASATVYGPRCTAAEACLNLNVFRPTGTSAAAKLPVLFYVFGGSFDSGGASAYNPEALIRRSVAIANPIIFVSIEYRLGALGFLGGADLAAAGGLNLGLQDQRLALEWVRDNVAAFGGDSAAVTVWGQSAGAISLAAQMAYGGGAAPLFRGAILMSGTLGTLGAFAATSAWPARTALSQDDKYATVLGAAGCEVADDRLGCLRSASLSSIRFGQSQVASAGGLPWAPVPDDVFVPSSAADLYSSGAFADIPTIVGDVLDEGPFFVASGRYCSSAVSDATQLAAYLANLFPSATPDQIDALLAQYPSSPAAGSPFGTGTSNNLWPEYKRLGAVFGDVAFQAPRRAFLAAASEKGSSTWAYQFAQPVEWGRPSLGVSHGSELHWFYGNAYPSGLEQTALMNAMTDYFIYFATSGNPNGGKLASWPAYTQAAKEEMQFLAGSVETIADTYRHVGMDYVNAHPWAFNQ